MMTGVPLDPRFADVTVEEWCGLEARDTGLGRA
jgi:hypothetical protein